MSVENIKDNVTSPAKFLIVNPLIIEKCETLRIKYSELVCQKILSTGTPLTLTTPLVCTYVIRITQATFKNVIQVGFPQLVLL